MRKLAGAKPIIVFVWPAYARSIGEYCHSTMGPDVLVKLMIKAGLPPSQYTIINVPLVPECVNQGCKPTKAQIKACAEDTAEKIDREQPDLILAVGATSFETLTGRKRIMDWVGRELNTNEGMYDFEYPVIPILHPDHVATYPIRSRDLGTALKCAAVFFRDKDGASKRKRKVRYTHYTKSQWKEAREMLLSLPPGLLVFDYETNCLDPLREPNPYIVVTGFCWAAGHACTLELGPEENENHNTVRMVLRSRRWTKAAHNTKFELKWTRAILGVTNYKRVKHDTMLMHHLVEEEASHRLEILAMEHTTIGGYDNEVKELLSQGIAHHEMPIDKIAYYCAGDCDATYRLFHVLQNKISSDENHVGLWNEYTERMIPSMHTLVQIEEDGMALDADVLTNFLHDAGKEYEQKVTALNKHRSVRKALKLLDAAEDAEFNINSPDQVRVLLYNVLGLPVMAWTKTGNASTGVEALDTLKDKHTIVSVISDLRTLRADIRDVEEIQNWTRPDGRVNSNFRQDVVVSHRLSSTEPNLQNIRRGSAMRRGFTSRFDGGFFLQADYKQLEVRLLGSLAQEPVYIKAFADKIDAHSLTASMIFDIPLEEVDKVKHRYPAKRTNFGVIYGIGPNKLAKELGWEKPAAVKMLAKYFQKHPYVTVWMEVQRARARAAGYITNVFGLVRRLPDINSTDNMTRWGAERKATNFAIQSVGAAFTKRAMNRLHELFVKMHLRSVLIGQVHDSVIVDVHPKEVDTVLSLLQQVMTDEPSQLYDWLTIPLEIDITIGPNWLEQHEVETLEAPVR